MTHRFNCQDGTGRETVVTVSDGPEPREEARRRAAFIFRCERDEVVCRYLSTQTTNYVMRDMGKRNSPGAERQEVCCD